jgi:hypothetical protein
VGPQVELDIGVCRFTERQNFGLSPAAFAGVGDDSQPATIRELDEEQLTSVVVREPYCIVGTG